MKIATNYRRHQDIGESVRDPHQVRSQARGKKLEASLSRESVRDPHKVRSQPRENSSKTPLSRESVRDPHKVRSQHRKNSVEDKICTASSRRCNLAIYFSRFTGEILMIYFSRFTSHDLLLTIYISRLLIGQMTPLSREKRS